MGSCIRVLSQDRTRLVPILDTSYFSIDKSLKDGEYRICLENGMYNKRPNIVELGIYSRLAKAERVLEGVAFAIGVLNSTRDCVKYGHYEGIKLVDDMLNWESHKSEAMLLAYNIIQMPELDAEGYKNGNWLYSKLGLTEL